MAHEFDFIEWIRGRQKPAGWVRLAAGDDLAVLAWPHDELLLIGVDQVLDGVHFDSAIHSPNQIGRKAMNRNLSDCAAMACLPAAAVATVALPRGADLDYAKALYMGMSSAADAFGCPIVGGDTGSWAGKLVMTVTVLGRGAGIRPITRKGAMPGDSIYVTGPLGGSIVGRHMTFTPRIDLARALATTGQIHAMIDLSDGLSRDLRHICNQSGAGTGTSIITGIDAGVSAGIGPGIGPGIGAVIDAGAIPIHADARVDRGDHRSPLEHALHDGEDYELLFTSPGEFPGAIRIGQMIAEPGVWLSQNGARVALEPKGWEHIL